MRDVVTTSAVFFSYALLAVFAQNAVFTRALGVSRLVQLVGDDRTSSWLFGMQLCITQVLVTPFAWYAGSRIAPLANRAQLRPLVYIASIAVVCVLEHAVLWLAKGLPHRSALLRIVPLAGLNSCVLGTVLVERTQSFTLGQSLGFGLGSGQLGSIPRGLLLMAQGIQLIVGGKGRLCLRHLSGKNIQLGGIACVAGALGTGSFQHRQGSGKLCLLCGQLCGQLAGLLGGTQLTLYFVQLGFGVLEGSRNGFLRGLLACQQTFQQGKGRLRLGLGVQCGKGIGIRVVGRKPDAGEQTVQLCILGGALLAEGGAFGLQALLQPGVALGAEQLAEDAAALLGGGVEQPGELSLCDHGNLAELAVIQPDDLHDGGGHVLGSGHRRAGVGKGEDGIRLLGGEAFAAHLGTGVFRVAAHGIALPVHLKFQLHKGGCSGVGILAAQHGTLAHTAAGMVVQGVCNGIEQGGLACAGVAGDKVQAAFSQFFQFQHGLARIGAKGRKGQSERSHASSPSFQISSMSCWQNAACSAVRGWLFCSW